jgi:hypothetical protein
MNDCRVTRFTVGPTLLLVLLALVIRLGISDRPLWFDEASTYWQARPSPLIQGCLSFSTLPALLVRQLPGRWERPWMLRLPFLLLGLGSIVLFQLAVRELDGDRAARVTALLLSLSPFHAYYSTEMRMYALVLFAAAANFLFFIRILHRHGAWNWLGYGAATVLGIAAHLFFVLLLVAQGAYLLIEDRRLLGRWLVAQIPIAIGAAPAVWYGLVVHGVSADKLGWIHRRPLLALVGTVYSFLMGVVVVPVFWWWVLAALTAASFGFLFLRGILADRPLRTLLVLSAIAPLAALIIASVWADVYSEQTTRYLAFLQPFFFLLAVRGWLAINSPRLRATVLGTMIVALCLSLVPMFTMWDQVGMGNYDQAAARLRALAEAHDRIVCSKRVGLPIAYQLRDGLIRRMVIGRIGELPMTAPPPPRLWVLELHDRSMWDFVRSPSTPTIRPPPSPDGYKLVRHEIIPGRKVISMTLFEHIGAR